MSRVLFTVEKNIVKILFFCVTYKELNITFEISRMILAKFCFLLENYTVDRK